MPDISGPETSRMLDRGDTPMSLDSCVSMNVDGSGSESEDAAEDSGSRVIADSEYHDNDDAETASLHSNSTDGGKNPNHLPGACWVHYYSICHLY